MDDYRFRGREAVARTVPVARRPLAFSTTCSRCSPALAASVQRTRARPVESVRTRPGVILPERLVNATSAPATGLRKLSVTITATG